LLSKLTYKKSPSIAKFRDITNLVVACVFGGAVAYLLGIPTGEMVYERDKENFIYKY
jgi:hypothetical protein